MAATSYQFIETEYVVRTLTPFFNSLPSPLLEASYLINQLVMDNFVNGEQVDPANETLTR